MTPQRSLKILETRRRFTDEQKNIAVQKALELMHGEYRSLYSTARELGVCQTALGKMKVQLGMPGEECALNLA